MDTKQVLDTINADLFDNSALRVIYLEGKTDPPILFGLLGLPQPAGGVFLHKNTLVKGFEASDSSGNKTVRAYVQIAQANSFDGRVYGIVDGDGDELAQLASQFDPPHTGPLFAWKAYSIESLLPQIGWPPAWGASPDWATVLLDYTPYVALNRLRRILEQRLQTLRLDKFRNPIVGPPLETTTNIEAALQSDKGLLTNLDVAAEFGNEVRRFQTALASSVEEGLVLLNGKWLLRHFLLTRLGKNPDYWCREWLRHGEATGGLLSVCDLWQRITGSSP